MRERLKELLGKVLGSGILIFLVLGMDRIKAELNIGRTRPLTRSFDVAAYVYLIVAVAVVILGIRYGGIG